MPVSAKGYVVRVFLDQDTSVPYPMLIETERGVLPLFYADAVGSVHIW